MNIELRKRKLEKDERLAREVFSLAKSLINQPATGLIIGFVSLKALNKSGILTGPETAVLGAIIGSTTALQAFKPLNLGN